MNDLIKLRQQKIRQKLRYLQLELMETKIIYKNSLRKFHQDFSQDISEQPKPDKKVDTKDPYEQIETEVSEDTMKKVYRKVANKVHPDKKGGDKEKFQLAAKANKNKDFGQLLEMADELEIDIELSNELIAEEFSKLSSIQFIGLRFFTVYGPYGRPDMAYYKFSQKIQKKEKITLYNKGNMSRDMTYVDDIVNGIVLSIDKKIFETSHEIFNLGNTHPISTIDLIKIIERRYKRKALISHKSSENEVFITHADITKSQKILGYKPVTNLVDGMYNFFEWLDQM